MTRTRDQYLAEVWDATLEYLLNNRKVEAPLLETFYRPSYLEDFNDSKAMVITNNVIAKEILAKNADIIAASFMDLNYIDHMIPVEFYLESDLEKLRSTAEQIPLFLPDEEFESMPI